MIWLSLAWAQPLASLLPTGSVAGVALNSSLNQPQLASLGRDWLASGLEEALGETLASLNLEADLLGLAQGGLAAALYPDGEVFVVAQPSDQALNWFRQQTQGGQLQSGWRSRSLPGEPWVVGLNQRQAVLASPAQWRRFMAGQRGGAVPVAGQLVVWVNRPAAVADPQLLPPTLARGLTDLEQWVWAIRLTPQGIESESRLVLTPQASRQSRQFWLAQNAPWSLDTLPAAAQFSTGSWNPAVSQQLLNGLLAELGLEEQFSLAGLGPRYASLTPQVKGRPGQPVWLLEVVQKSQAEASLQQLARWLTAFTDPAGRARGWSNPDAQGLRQLDLGTNGAVYMLLEANRLYLAPEAESLLAIARSNRKGQWPAGLRERIPPQATGYSYSPTGNLSLGPLGGDSLGDALGLLGTDPGLGRALERWQSALAPRLGSSYGYSLIKGNELITLGFAEVRWAGR